MSVRLCLLFSEVINQLLGMLTLSSRLLPVHHFARLLISSQYVLDDDDGGVVSTLYGRVLSVSEIAVMVVHYNVNRGTQP